MEHQYIFVHLTLNILICIFSHCPRKRVRKRERARERERITVLRS